MFCAGNTDDQYFSHDLRVPTCFAAANVIDYDQNDQVRYHYTILEVCYSIKHDIIMMLHASDPGGMMVWQMGCKSSSNLNIDISCSSCSCA